MSYQLPLQTMSQAEKLEAFELLWCDLASRPAEFSSPQWHADVLTERTQALEAERTSFIDWEDAKKRLEARHK